MCHSEICIHLTVVCVCMCVCVCVCVFAYVGRYLVLNNSVCVCVCVCVWMKCIYIEKCDALWQVDCPRRKRKRKLLSCAKKSNHLTVTFHHNAQAQLAENTAAVHLSVLGDSDQYKVQVAWKSSSLDTEWSWEYIVRFLYNYHLNWNALLRQTG